MENRRKREVRIHLKACTNIKELSLIIHKVSFTMPSLKSTKSWEVSTKNGRMGYLPLNGSKLEKRETWNVGGHPALQVEKGLRMQFLKFRLHRTAL